MFGKMRAFYLTVVCYAVFSTALPVKQCLPAEEGTSHNITCVFNGTLIGQSFQLPWIAVNETNPIKVATCYFGHCEYEDGFKAGVQGNTSTLTIFNVSRSEQFNHKTNWRCGDTRFLCEPLQVYAKPKKVVCELQPVNASSDHMAMTCKAERMYPQGYCTVYTSTDNANFTPILSSVACTNMAWNETPIYYKAECPLKIHLRHFHTGPNYFKVKIYPQTKVFSGFQFGVDSEIYTFTLNISHGDTTSSILMSPYLALVLGIAFAVTLCAAVFLCILVLRYRRISNSQVQHMNAMPMKQSCKVSHPDYNIASANELEDTSNEVYEEVKGSLLTSAPNTRTAKINRRNNIYGNVEKMEVPHP